MRRRVLIIISVLAGIAAFITVYNPIVTTILESDQHTLLSGRTMLITMENEMTQNKGDEGHRREKWCGGVFGLLLREWAG